MMDHLSVDVHTDKIMVRISKVMVIAFCFVFDGDSDTFQALEKDRASR